MGVPLMLMFESGQGSFQFNPQADPVMCSFSELQWLAPTGVEDDRGDMIYDRDIVRVESEAFGGTESEAQVFWWDAEAMWGLEYFRHKNGRNYRTPLQTRTRKDTLTVTGNACREEEMS